MKKYSILKIGTILMISFTIGINESLFGQKHNEPTIDLFIDNLFYVTEVMVTDVASPPAAARFYAYSMLGAHLAWNQLTSSSDESCLFSKSNLPSPDLINGTEKKLSPEFVATYAMMEVGKKIMPSGKLLEIKQEELIKTFTKSKWLSKRNLNEHVLFAQQVAAEVLKISGSDGYNQLSTLTRYTPKRNEGHWYPTPPAYMAAVEPEWRTLKTFFISDLAPYKPNPPAPFNLEEGSSFKNQMTEVFEVTSNLTDEQKLVANFWDCNPFMVQFSGHMAIGMKKISPGGHWVGITGIASKKAGLSWKETIYIHTLVSMALHDAFVSCWEEKYDSDRIRPESAIQKYVDQSWRPLLQTPPFPEYTSGHSVISKTSAMVLTDYFGDNFDFIDDSEVYFGLPEREFNSFNLAAEEAAISRLYGGIHFRDAIEEGVKQGEKIAKFILDRVN
ncbi:vanadium-dependent haloperoxidase [Aquiflexum lacus]|uniref:vanadium-dependent haloperoxidase n=1 Tax=Aquiflexum lacus TaxID=2483805 RepID=UPI001893226F|nr:vanadium-dependent haloperoxidase [Aquiflexum lacus]